MYAMNRKKYYELLSLFQEKYTLAAPYAYSSMIGFFGVATMSYFFIKLRQGKKVIFLEKDSRAYDFIDDKNADLMKWMFPFFYSLLFSFFSFLFLIIFAVMLNFKWAF
ncbi:hypothetical protein H2241_07270 [Pantoea ananatis]|nr:hypothetical protein [Pantoea ananatis]QKV90285.1 hypothetical protein FOB88_19875 [Pantoea ananatis]